MKKFILILPIILTSFIFFSGFVLAGEGDTGCPPGSVCLDNPLGADTTVQTLIGKVIKSVLGVVGSLALLMFIYGGFTWMTAAGVSKRRKGSALDIGQIQILNMPNYSLKRVRCKKLPPLRSAL